MKTLFVPRGLPGSGKSTWAKEKVLTNPGQYKRISKDDLRDQLDAGKYSRHNEEFILQSRDALVVLALTHGKHVIVDDTNLLQRHVERMRQLARENGAGFEVVDFTHVSPEECIKRDLQRARSVGESVIRKMYRDFLAPPIPKIEQIRGLPFCFICDIDGTLALMNGRGPYEEEKVDTDLPNWPIVDLVVTLVSAAQTVIFVSGRHERAREKTTAWLRHWIGIEAPILYMRPDDDGRQDSIIKSEIFEREFRGKWNVRYVLDDRQRVVDGWRSLGLTCLQVAPGDF